jgi:transposase, IS6 family
MKFMFKRRRFSVAMTLACVRSYRKYGISYHGEMMRGLGMEFDSATFFRWVQRYAPVF